MTADKIPVFDEHGNVVPPERLFPTVDSFFEHARRLRDNKLTAGARPAGTAIFSVPAEPEAIWGSGQRVLWAKGESLMVVGPSGTGKSTLVQQVVFELVGVRRRQHVLGLPVIDDGRKVLYLAADRPRQVLRSMQRMVTPADVDILNDRIVVWEGPLPGYVPDDTELLRDMAQANGCGYIVVDSMKDLAYDLEKPETAAQYNAARQIALAAGIDMAEVHHNRKAGKDASKPNKLSDVFGGAWITAGAGSVVCVWGEAGDEAVEFSHLKLLADKLGPWDLEHDHESGVTEIRGEVDPWALLCASPAGLSARSLAQALYGREKVNKAETVRCRRILDKFVSDAKATKSTGDGDAALYRPVADAVTKSPFVFTDKTAPF